MTKKVAIIFISLVILLAIGVGVYLFLGKKPPVSNQAPVKKLTEIQVASWKTYQNKDFSFQYPADWNIVSSNLSLGSINLKTDTISNFPQRTASTSAGTSTAYFDYASDGAIISLQNGTIASSSGKLLGFTEIVKERFISTQFNGPDKIMFGNKREIKYTNKQKGAWTNYAIVPYDGGIGNYYEISLDYVNGKDTLLDYPKLLDKIISSFTFVK